MIRLSIFHTQIFLLTCGLYFLAFAYGVPSGQSKAYNGEHHRNIRSPHFGFNIKDKFSDLSQQLRPPSLSDLNDFKEKILNLANFTAILEKAVEAEKTARTSLHNFVHSIKEQVTGIQAAVNPDPENYWSESTECGGILVSQTGRISYKSNEHYKNNERCIWTIRANYRSTIKVTFNGGDLESDHDYVAVTQLSSKNNDRTGWVTKKIISGQANLFKGPIIFITFSSDGSIRKTGFQLNFEGLGNNINTRTKCQHFHFTDWIGDFTFSNLSESMTQNNMELESGDELKATIVINPSYWNVSKLHMNVPENLLDLGDDCHTNLAVLNDISEKLEGSSVRCCGKSCESHEFETANRIVVGILSSSDLTEHTQFTINWSTVINIEEAKSVDTCGGIVSGDMGRILYHTDSRYKNNERCLWVIQGRKVDDAVTKIQLLKSGFEYQYDYVSLTYIVPESSNSVLNTQFLYKAGDPITVPGIVFFIEFYSDAATFGKTTGFELLWEIKYKHSTRNQPSVKLEYSTEESGSKTLSCLDQDNSSENIIISAINYQSVRNEDESHFENTLMLESETTISEEISIFKSEKGNFSAVETGKAFTSEIPDGIFIVVQKCAPTTDSQSQDAVINWRKGQAENEVPTEDKLFASSEDACGEILHGDSGRISYKLGKDYDLNERCTWVIRTKTFPVISVQLMADGFESCCDGLQINRISPDGHLDTEAVLINRENRFQTFEGPLLLVTFYSDHSVNGTGFTLEFQTKGEPLIDTEKNMEVTHQHSQANIPPSSAEPFGPIIIDTSSEENLLAINTFVVRSGHEIPNDSPSVILEQKNLETRQCHHDSVQLYHMPEITKYQLLKGYPENELSCTVTGLADELSASLPLSLATLSPLEKIKMKNVLVVVTKINSGSSGKSLSVTLE